MDLIVLRAGVVRLLVIRAGLPCGCRVGVAILEERLARTRSGFDAFRRPALTPPRAPDGTERGQRAPSGTQRLQGAHRGRR